MNEPSTAGITRRRFMHGLGIAAGGAAVGAGLLLTLTRRGGTGGDSPSLAAADLAAVRHIGEVYLGLHPGLDAGALRRKLPKTDLANNAASSLHHLRDQVRRDYATGDVEMVDGWRLSGTALRAAALLALGG